jgi:glutamate-1-semialdehyde 2,1-aminomutase
MSQAVAAGIDAAYRDRFPTSARLFEQGRRLFPSGVTHDSRYLKPFPVFIDRALGSKKYDVDGHEIIDYWMGHGSLLLGHSHPAVVEAVSTQVAKGTHFGANQKLEMDWGELVRRLIPSVERVRFTSSGTEATLMAIRIARIVTGRQKVLKFLGHFHGWHDVVMPNADAPYDLNDLSTPGVTDGVLQDLVMLPPNNLEAVAAAIDKHQPACLILEATGGHWSLVPMRGEFLHGLRKLTAEKGVLLIFDEVITGFRVSPGGAQSHYGITPDLTTMAKILAGGLPGGAVGGRADVMDALEFDNPHGQKMRHPGTYNGNPLSASAGIAALQQLVDGTPNRQANEMGRMLRTGLNDLFARRNLNFIAYGEFSMLAVLPNYNGPRSPDDSFIPYDNQLDKLDAKRDPALTHAFRCALLLNGVDFFGWRAMMSAAHTRADVQRTIAAFSSAIDLLRKDGFVV